MRRVLCRTTHWACRKSVLNASNSPQITRSLDADAHIDDKANVEWFDASGKIKQETKPRLVPDEDRRR